MRTTAYYFRAHTYTLVPHQVREDMKWMADHGTDNVALGVLEQDLFAAQENIALIGEEAKKAGMQLYAVPSRWGSLVAGSPKVPSIFCALHPDALAMNEDGTPCLGAFGPLASVHHPATMEFFCQSLEEMLSLFPIKGIIWDEVKNLHARDYSPAALKALEGKDPGAPETTADSSACFFDRLGREALSIDPSLHLNLFLYGHLKGYAAERMARIEHLHDYGCDGRPFRLEDGGSSDSISGEARKSLCDQGPYFIDLARRAGKNALLLIENHGMNRVDDALMDKRLADVLALEPDHLLYYYFPRSLEDPYGNMAVLGRHLLQKSI